MDTLSVSAAVMKVSDIIVGSVISGRRGKVFVELVKYKVPASLLELRKVKLKSPHKMGSK